jgi:perosamine synthetase
MIPVSRPDLDQEELKELEGSLESGWIGLGPKVEKFEDEFAKKFNYSNVIATNSCTSALDLALKAADLEGDTVLVPTITWVSTAFAALYNDLEVEFVDVKKDTLNMDPKSLEAKISGDTAAVIPVHYGGRPADIEDIINISRENNAKVIQDCAHAVGAEVEDDYVGLKGDIACFSFEAKKILTTGEGGAVVTNDDELAERIKRLSRLGVDKSTHEREDEEGYNWYYEVKDKGYKYFMHDISAGIGLAQLEKFEELVKRRREIADRYHENLSKIDDVETLNQKDEVRTSYYNFTIKVPPEERENIIEYLGERDIGVSVHYMPLYKHPVFDDKNPETPNTEEVWRKILTIPMTSTMSDEDVEKVIKSIEEFFERERHE